MSWIRERTLNWFQSLILKILRTGHVPRHVAFIMDGNRRYANKKNVAKVEGHARGFDKLSETLNWCMDLGVVEVTVYAFSIENFKRSKEEVDGLMELAKQKFERLLEEKDKLKEKGVCVRVIGNLSLLPKDLRKLMAEAMIVTKNNNKSFLNVAFAYTSRDEITHAIKDITKGVKHADILPEDISENLISDCLYTYNSPNPDLLIRTSGEVRLSDFLMWQISDTCVYFTDVLWPEFSIWHFFSAILYYQKYYPDLQRDVKMRNSKKPTTHNNRVSTYVNKLHREREIMIENMYLPAVQS
ncbi:dehydrodolichyl diphosphate synthase complex subunit DHDDS [Pseudomyrmex gracilis]|uniref:dehydrodolichyl diphosphate synthase complex subunit DHDDS n=1 Tax=Pseudomyrmex gracilis TaxID=219809 RepID=UPI0009950669|nr:dehydrodolichyl diphosphate synthase complex subunit DHDDS [Pseudomyrmex gracilis]XP_020294416.1 dehydrodolichyl diphosphate synthase complex subunit DHDDS [Pseudomyrmex gracilis]